MPSNPLQGLISALGRLLLAAIFLMSALGNKIPKFNDVAGYMATEGVPAPKIMLAGAIVFLIVGAVSVVLGYKTRLGELDVSVQLVPITTKGDAQSGPIGTLGGQG